MAVTGVTQPIMTASLNGSVLPCFEVLVTQSAYGQADIAHAKIVLSKATADYGAISQSGKYLPFNVQVGTVQNGMLQALYAYLDEIDTSYLEDEIEFSARGLLSVLLDTKISLKALTNVDVTTAIRSVITGLGMNAMVNNGKPAGIDAGKILVNEFSTMSKNIKAMDYINALAFGVGWRPRAKGNTIIVGPPPDSAPILYKSAAKGGLQNLKVKHSALHAHDISVRVVSYIPHKKTRVVATAGQGNSADEQYVFSVPGLTQEVANFRATQIQAELSRHEFIAELEFAPTFDEMQFIARNSPEFNVQIEDCSQGSHNQVYTPRRVDWTWNTQQGCMLKILAVNHAIPQN